jgi:hypothetical protein
MSTELVVSKPGLHPLATKPNPAQKQIFGFHAENHGESFAVVCLTVDGKDVKHVTVHHSFLWPQREVSFNDLAAELKRCNAYGTTRLNAVPIVWEHYAEPFAKRLIELDCAMLREDLVYKETPEIARRLTMEIEERMRKRLFSVEPADNAAWLEEHARFGIGSDGQIPLTGYPLMSATRHAFAQLDRARLPGEKLQPIKYPRRGYV